MNENLALQLAKDHQYIIVADGFNGDGSTKYVIRKVHHASAIRIGTEIVWCVNFLEPLEDESTGVSEEHILSYTSNGRIYPTDTSNIKHIGIYTPKCERRLEVQRKRLNRISQILNIELKTCQQKIKRIMKAVNLCSHGTLINPTERQITISSYKSEENLEKALQVCARFNRYNMCIHASAMSSKHSVEMNFQF